MADIDLEVSEFLDRWQPPYEHFHNDILRELGDFRDKPTNMNCIYRIYSRSDKQIGGRKLKSARGIAEKLSKKREINPDFEIEDLGDIIGITIVTYFDSEILPLIERFREDGAFDGFCVSAHEQKEENGYFAYHIALEGAGKHSVNRMKAELQMKPLLADGWAAKMHDMVYKPQGFVDPALDTLVAQIGENIRNLEKQSDSLRTLISRNHALESERRESAIKQLTFAITQNVVPKAKGKEIPADADAIISDLAQEVLQNKDRIGRCRIDAPDARDLMQRWKKMPRSKGKCRFILFLAMLRPENDLDDIALEEIDRWARAERKRGHHERVASNGFRSFSYWALGKLDRAIEISEQNLADVQSKEFRDSPKRNPYLASGLLELAYYRAERLFSRSSSEGDDEERRRIRALIAAAPPVLEKRKQMVHKDSIGAITVMIATTNAEIMEGEKLYTQAYNWAKNSKTDRATFEHFFQLNEHRRKRRALDLLR